VACRNRSGKTTDPIRGWSKIQPQVEHLPVGVEDEGDVSHFAVGEAFFERNTESLEAGAGSLDIGDSEGDVAEATGLGVARVVRGAFEGLGAVVVRQLEDTW